MQLRTSETLLDEARSLISSQVPIATARVQGILKFYSIKADSEGLSKNTGVHWILRAQLGTLGSGPIDFARDV